MYFLAIFILNIPILPQLYIYQIMRMKPQKDQAQKKEAEFQYVYFKDSEGKIKRLRKPVYQPRQGYIRLKFFEKYYFWWHRKSFDYKNAIVPLFLGLTASFIIYHMGMIWSQNDLQRQIKARLPFEYSIEMMKDAEKGNFDKIQSYV